MADAHKRSIKAVFAEWRNNLHLRRDNRSLTFLAYAATLAGLGLGIASLGPALLVLALQTSSTLRETGYCFAARSVGYLLGSFSGPLYDKLPAHRVLSGALLLAGLGSLLIPVVRSVAALGLVVSFQGAAMGFVDTGANVLLIYLYGAEVGPFLQFIHFGFAVGAFLSPMLQRAVAPPLPGGDGADPASRMAPAGAYNGAFYIIGVYCMALAAFVLWLKSPQPRGGAGSAPAAAESEKSGTASGLAAEAGGAEVDVTAVVPAAEGGAVALPAPAAPAPAPAAPAASTGVVVPAGYDVAKARRAVVIFISMILFMYVGCETGFGAFIAAYCVLGLGQTEAHGQLLAAFYWGAIMLGRFAAVFISVRVPPARYLGASMWGCVASMVLLLIGQSHVVTVWLFTISFGLFMACIFPTAVALAETFFPVQGKDATFFVVGSAVGEFILPAIITTLFGNAPGEEGVGSNSSEGVVKDSLTVGPVIMFWVVAAGCSINMLFYRLAVKNGPVLAAALAEKAAAAAAPPTVTTAAA